MWQNNFAKRMDNMEQIHDNKDNLVIINDQQFSILTRSDPIVMKSKTGEKTWVGYVVQDSVGNFYLTSSWFNKNTKTGKTSVTQFATPYLVTQKNVGRANETSVNEQALLEFDSMVKKELDKRASDRPLPMLAQTFTKRKKYISYPAAAQPKLNGMRMLYDGTKAWSRGGKDIIPECIAHLQFDTKGYIIDGELILKDNPLLQETMRATKKYREGVSENLMYYVYDIVDESMTFEERSILLQQLVNDAANPSVEKVANVSIVDEDHMKRVHAIFTTQENPYEGTMIRNWDSKYEINQRSNGLQKYKSFLDDEFKIVGVIEGDGSFKGCAIFVCETEDGKTQFNCTPEGSTEIRKEYFQQRDLLIGQWLTIRYQELSEDKVPLFPVGVSVRNDGDF